MSTTRSIVIPALLGVVVTLVVLRYFPEWLRPATPEAAPAVTMDQWQPAESTTAGLAGAQPATVAVVPPGPASYAQAVQTAAPAVVNIYTSQKIRLNPIFNDPLFQRFLGRQVPQERIQSSLGSGVIVSDKGYVLTNHHVVANADEIRVALRDGREADASVVGTDPDTDLAVLRIKLDKLPVIRIRTETPQVGDVVLAIGNPFGVGQTVTQGIISATGRHGLGINAFEDFVQTDAAINPGNSGGALVDVQGQLVAINSAIFSKSGGSMGIGFSIPARLAQSVMKSLIDKGYVVRGWLGMQLQDMNDELAQALRVKSNQGVAVAGLVRYGPGHRAGMLPGDVITVIDGVTMARAEQVIGLVAARAPGSALTVTLLREGREMRVKVTVGERPSQTQQQTQQNEQQETEAFGGP